MKPAPVNIVVVVLTIAATVALASIYLRRVSIERPPVGKYNSRDIAIMMVFVVVLPPLYLRLPSWIVALLLGAVFLGVLRFTLTPLLRSTALWAALVLVAVDLASALVGDRALGPWMFLAANNALVVIGVVGVCNLYVQNGMSARDVVFFGVALGVYDFVATVFLPVMVEFFEQLRTIPFTPIMAWGRGRGAAPIGLGDVLMLTLWALVAWKAFGSTPGWIAAATGIATVSCFYWLASVDLIPAGVPTMAALGPLMGLEYAVFRRVIGPERTVSAFRHRMQGDGAQHEEGRPAVSSILSGLMWYEEHPGGERANAGPSYVALFDGHVLATGRSAGEARRAARELDPGVVPMIVYVTSE
jgi:hypothetical protein